MGYVICVSCIRVCTRFVCGYLVICRVSWGFHRVFIGFWRDVLEFARLYIYDVSAGYKNGFLRLVSFYRTIGSVCGKDSGVARVWFRIFWRLGELVRCLSVLVSMVWLLFVFFLSSL